ncbi:FecR family protein [Pedobacter chitinilyticus]|uniref:FecR family protein n=1 Tax=Pedobacter chitinilyticus TaxID=2233776 RepID=A0A3S3PIC9_9SPHI|nr:FecR family protein [Pedobacter chitinilyticus]RWU10211.1 FecR family protein [Pedobacter chitinilyticus]
MDKKTFLDILSKYNKGKASKQEVDLLEAYYELFEVEENILDQMDLSEKQLLKQQMLARVLEKNIEIVTTKTKTWYDRSWLSAAAVLLILCSVGLLLFKKDRNEIAVVKKSETPTAVIKPGKNQAILTLSDGSTIGLNEEEKGIVLSKNGLLVTKSGDGELKYETNEELIPTTNTITTPRGGQYQLVLTDGTKVWLNAQSSIKFPTRFAGDTRVVHITGEVYFEVAKNKKMPFLVHTHNQKIEVLGTHFNVNTYIDEAAEKTTLIEGSVKVAKVRDGFAEMKSAKLLRPGQEALLTSESSLIKVGTADTEAAISWKNGYFKFDKADIQTVMRQISRWYDVDVKYVGNKSSDLFVGKIKRTEEIQGILRILERSKINTSVKGRTIIITN